MWQIGRSAFGVAAPPGIKRAMIEELNMDFEESPPDATAGLDRAQAVQQTLEDALLQILARLVQRSDWMDAYIVRLRDGAPRPKICFIY